MAHASSKLLANALSPKLIFLLGALSALAAISTDIYLPALTDIGANLNASNAQVQTTLAIFFIGYGFGQLFFGPLSDSLGRRSVLLTGLYLFVFASIACALSTSIDVLIVSRLLQAVGGCAAAVTARAIIRDTTEGEQTAKAIAGVMATIQIAPLIAPPIGGLILLFAPWQATFYALTIYGVLSIIAAHLWIDESHPEEKRQPLQVSNIFQGYWLALANPNILFLMVAEISATVVLLTFVTGSALIFIQYYGLSPQAFSLLFAFIASGLAIGSYISSRIVTKKGITFVINACLLFGIVSGLVMLGIAIFLPEKIMLLIAALWFCLIPSVAARANYVGLGLQYMPERAGTISALFGAFSLGIGGMTALVVGMFAYFTPALMAGMILFGYIFSMLFYVFWRLYNRFKKTI